MYDLCNQNSNSVGRISIATESVNLLQNMFYDNPFYHYSLIANVIITCVICVSLFHSTKTLLVSENDICLEEGVRSDLSIYLNVYR